MHFRNTSKLFLEVDGWGGEGAAAGRCFLRSSFAKSSEDSAPGWLARLFLTILVLICSHKQYCFAFATFYSFYPNIRLFSPSNNKTTNNRRLWAWGFAFSPLSGASQEGVSPTLLRDIQVHSVRICISTRSLQSREALPQGGYLVTCWLPAQLVRSRGADTFASPGGTLQPISTKQPFLLLSGAAWV